MRATGGAAPERYGAHRRVLEPHEAVVRGLVAATPDITLAELRTELQRGCGVRAGLSTHRYWRIRLGTERQEG